MYTMTNNTVEPPKKNRNVILFIAIAVILLIAGGITAFAFSSSDMQNPDGSSSDDSTSDVVSDAPPEILNVTTALNETSLEFTVEADAYDATEWFLEYELADQNRKVVETDYARDSSFMITTPLTQSSSYRLKVRLTDKETQTSEWSESYSIQIDELEGANVLEPNEAYYSSAWSKGEGTEENLRTALEVAYNAQPAPADAATYCIPMNSGSMKPTLLLPPMPAISPSNVTLSYNINSWNAATQEALITYYWC